MGKSNRSNCLHIESLEALSRPAPVKGRVNEDAWLVLDSPAYPSLVTIAVIDGAGVRKPLPSLVSGIKKYYPSLTPSAYVAYLLKTSLLDQLRREPERPLSEALITANETLRRAIEQIIGSFDPIKILAELNEPLGGEPRNIRLVLPACVVTVARLDLTNCQLNFAHLGDTSLLELCHDGEAIQHTTDQMAPFDKAAFEAVADLQRRRGLPHFKDAVMLPEGRRFIIESGLQLNYVDTYGKTNRQQGCGVIDGLPEVADYIETGIVTIDPERTLGFVLLSDGLELLSSPGEKMAQRKQRLRRTARLIRRSGLCGLYDAMSKMAESDVHLDRYPRSKVQDDATGIYVRIGLQR